MVYLCGRQCSAATSIHCGRCEHPTVVRSAHCSPTSTISAIQEKRLHDRLRGQEGVPNLDGYRLFPFSTMDDLDEPSMDRPIVTFQRREGGFPSVQKLAGATREDAESQILDGKDKRLGMKGVKWNVNTLVRSLS